MQQQAHAVGREHSLLHGEALLVVAAGDAEHLQASPNSGGGRERNESAPRFGCGSAGRKILLAILGLKADRSKKGPPGFALILQMRGGGG